MTYTMCKHMPMKSIRTSLRSELRDISVKSASACNLGTCSTSAHGVTDMGLFKSCDVLWIIVLRKSSRGLWALGAVRLIRLFGRVRGRKTETTHCFRSVLRLCFPHTNSMKLQLQRDAHTLKSVNLS